MMDRSGTGWSPAHAEPPRSGVRLYWLGQAGFAFCTAAGRRVFLDPYLSDACERLAA